MLGGRLFSVIPSKRRNRHVCIFSPCARTEARPCWTRGNSCRRTRFGGGVHDRARGVEGVFLMLRELGSDEGSCQWAWVFFLWICGYFMFLRLFFSVVRAPRLAPGGLAGASAVSLSLRIIIPNHVVRYTPCSLMSWEDIFILHLFCIIHYNSNRQTFWFYSG